MDFKRVDKQFPLSPLTEADFPVFVSRINAYVEASNFGSARVLEKCQFKLEAPLIMNYAKRDGE